METSPSEASQVTCKEMDGHQCIDNRWVLHCKLYLNIAFSILKFQSRLFILSPVTVTP